MTDTEWIAKTTDFAERLLGVALDVVAASQVTLNENWARDPKIIGLTLLSRSLTNFRAAMVLLRGPHVHMVEARVVARCMYENLLWIAALREDGLKFVKEMLEDEAANKKALGELTLRITSNHGVDVNKGDSVVLRDIIKDVSARFPGGKKLHASKVAGRTVIEAVYVEYCRLSLQAVHCSVTALGWHLDHEQVEDGGRALVVNVHPDPLPRDVLATMILLCSALLAVAITANELLGFTSATPELQQLFDEFPTIETSMRGRAAS